MFEAIMYLEKFMAIAKRVETSQSLVDACTFLGNIYNERVSIHLNLHVIAAIVQNLYSCSLKLNICINLNLLF